MPIRPIKWLSGIWKGIRKNYKKLNEKVKHLAPIAIDVAEQIKKIIDSPIADVATDFIPGSLDNIIKDRLRTHLPRLILQLHMVADVANIEDENEQLQAIFARIRFSAKITQDTFYHNIASLTLNLLADGELSLGDAFRISQEVYDYLKVQKQAA